MLIEGILPDLTDSQEPFIVSRRRFGFLLRRWETR